MKKILTLIAGVCIAISSVAQSSSFSGWPANYGGVMFQSFYWDSYQDTQWTNLTSQADTLAKYFDLVWVPQSGYCNSLTNQMGYADIWWFNQKSAFGTADQLKTMISTLQEQGIGHHRRRCHQPQERKHQLVRLPHGDMAGPRHADMVVGRHLQQR